MLIQNENDYRHTKLTAVVKGHHTTIRFLNYGFDAI